MDDSIFIEILKYGAGKGLEGVSFEELKTSIHDHSDAESTETEHGLLKNVFDECFEQSDVGSGTEKFNLKTDYYFRLIEYQELAESRAVAKSANRNAFIAIGISVFVIIVTAVLTFTQLNTPATITKSELNALIMATRDAGVQREVKLDSMQMAQILSAIGYDQSNDRSKKQNAVNQGQEVSHHELINQYFEDE